MKKRLNSDYKIIISGLHDKNFIELKWLVRRKVVLLLWIWNSRTIQRIGTPVNPEVLKTNWYPATDFLIRQFVKQNKSHPMHYAQNHNRGHTWGMSTSRGVRGSAKCKLLWTGGEGRLVKWGCPHLEKFSKLIFEIAQAGGCLCNWIQLTCYLTTLKSYLGIKN